MKDSLNNGFSIDQDDANLVEYLKKSGAENNKRDTPMDENDDEFDPAFLCWEFQKKRKEITNKRRGKPKIFHDIPEKENGKSSKSEKQTDPGQIDDENIAAQVEDYLSDTDEIRDEIERRKNLIKNGQTDFSYNSKKIKMGVNQSIEDMHENEYLNDIYNNNLEFSKQEDEIKKEKQNKIQEEADLLLKKMNTTPTIKDENKNSSHKNKKDNTIHKNKNQKQEEDKCLGDKKSDKSKNIRFSHLKNTCDAARAPPIINIHINCANIYLHETNSCTSMPTFSRYNSFMPMECGCDPIIRNEFQEKGHKNIEKNYGKKIDNMEEEYEEIKNADEIDYEEIKFGEKEKEEKNDTEINLMNGEENENENK